MSEARFLGKHHPLQPGAEAGEQLVGDGTRRLGGLLGGKDGVPVPANESGGIAGGDAIGAVILFSRDPKVKMGDMELKLALTAANFLGRQMEN